MVFQKIRELFLPKTAKRHFWSELSFTEKEKVHLSALGKMIIKEYVYPSYSPRLLKKEINFLGKITQRKIEKGELEDLLKGIIANPSKEMPLDMFYIGLADEIIVPNPSLQSSSLYADLRHNPFFEGNRERISGLSFFHYNILVGTYLLERAEKEGLITRHSQDDGVYVRLRF